jgi:hypothetical protein
VESELNFIERYWGRAKWFMRDNYDYSLKELWALSERALGPENCNATLLRKYARTSWRWMDAKKKYRLLFQKHEQGRLWPVNHLWIK